MRSARLPSLLFFTFLSCILSSNALASAVVSEGYARATFPMAKTGAVYFSLKNPTQKTIHLSGVSTDASIADDAQIHTTFLDGDVMRMREVKDGITLAPSESVVFAPGGYHVMLLGLTKGLDEGGTVTLTLAFDDAESVVVSLPIKKDEKKAHHHHH